MPDLSIFANELRGVSDQALQSELVNPTGLVPSYLTLAEAQRRQLMRQAFEKQQTQGQSSSVYQDVIRDMTARQPAQGLPAAPAGMVPAANMTPALPGATPPQNFQAPPPQRMAHGGSMMPAPVEAEGETPPAPRLIFHPASGRASKIARALATQASDEALSSNNPGGLRFAPGQIGISPHGYAVFPTMDAGQRALHAEIEMAANRGLTLNEFLKGRKGSFPGFAASIGENPEEFAGRVQQELGGGVDPDTPLSQAAGQSQKAASGISALVSGPETGADSGSASQPMAVGGPVRRSREDGSDYLHQLLRDRMLQTMAAGGAVRRFDQGGANDDSPLSTEQIQDLVRSAAEKNKIDPDLAVSVAGAESSFNPKAVSPKGAIGVMQLEPATAKDLGVDPHDVRQNIEGGVRYLAQNINRFGDERLGVAAYNAGPGAIERHGQPFASQSPYLTKIFRDRDAASQNNPVQPNQISPAAAKLLADLPTVTLPSASGGTTAPQETQESSTEAALLSGLGTQGQHEQMYGPPGGEAKEEPDLLEGVAPGAAPGSELAQSLNIPGAGPATRSILDPNSEQNINARRRQLSMETYGSPTAIDDLNRRALVERKYTIQQLQAGLASQIQNTNPWTYLGNIGAGMADYAAAHPFAGTALAFAHGAGIASQYRDEERSKALSDWLGLQKESDAIDDHFDDLQQKLGQQVHAMGAPPKTKGPGSVQQQQFQAATQAVAGRYGLSNVTDFSQLPVNLKLTSPVTLPEDRMNPDGTVTKAGTVLPAGTIVYPQQEAENQANRSAVEKTAANKIAGLAATREGRAQIAETMQFDSPEEKQAYIDTGKVPTAAKTMEPMAREVAEYRMPLTWLMRSMQTPDKAKAIGLIRQFNPDWREENYDAFDKAQKDYTGGGKQGQKIQDVNRAIAHMGLLYDAVDALQSGNVKKLNQLTQDFGAAVGPTPAQTFSSLVQAVGPELSRIYIGAGTGAERGQVEKSFLPSLSPQQLKDNLGIRARGLGGIIQSLVDKYKADTFGQGDRHTTFFSPESVATLERIAPGTVRTITGDQLRQYASEKGISFNQAQKVFADHGVYMTQ